jgi:hypothetical protein
MKPLAGPRRFSPVPRNPLKTLNLAGCLVGCSPVPSVVRNPLKTLGSPVLAGPLSRNPHTPYRPRGRGRSLGSALPSGGLAPLRRPFFCTSSPPGVCVHCREGTRADDPFVLLFVASDRADLKDSA